MAVGWERRDPLYFRVETSARPGLSVRSRTKGSCQDVWRKEKGREIRVKARKPRNNKKREKGNEGCACSPTLRALGRSKVKYCSNVINIELAIGCVRCQGQAQAQKVRFIGLV